jgi:hypothetical protein
LTTAPTSPGFPVRGPPNWSSSHRRRHSTHARAIYGGPMAAPLTPRHNLHTSTRLPGALPSALEVPAGEAPGGVASTHARPRATEFTSGSPGPNRSSSQSSSSPRTRGLPQSVWCPWKRTKTPVPQDSLSPPNRYIEADGRLHLLSPSPPKTLPRDTPCL